MPLFVLRFAGQRADEQSEGRNLWLKLLDLFTLGFDT